tara:strand:- start:136 stop:987 length:852 start_codon:yes stop_codon:yes gene_type:complete
MRHNKYKNVGVIFESMIHHTLQLISEGKTDKAGKLMSLVRKYFIEKTAISESYNVFSQLLYSEAINYYHASRFYSRVLKEYNKLDDGRINAEISNLFEEMKKEFIIKEVINTRIPNYKLFSSFRISSDQDSQHLTSRDRMTVETVVLDHLVDNKEIKKLNENNVQSETKTKEELVTAQLATAIAFKSFEKEYRGKLNEDQKNCLIKYFSSTEKDFQIWATNQINGMLNEIADKKLNINNEDIGNKLDLVFERLEKISTNKNINGDHITDMMLGLELCNQLKYI